MTAVHVPFSSIETRRVLKWPDGNRLAVWICPNLEHYDYMPPRQRSRDPWPRMPHPDVLGYGEKDYGNRLGIWRLFDLLDRHGIRATASGGLTCFERYPEILEACLDRNWDCMCHGFENTSYLWDMPLEEERNIIRAAFLQFQQQFRRPLTGWFSPAASHTERTLELLIDAGVCYVCDWHHDEQPYPIRATNGTIITLPYTMHYNDVIARLRNQDVDAFCRMIRDAFEVLWREGSEQGRVLCIAMHPYVSGQPHWIGALDKLFSQLRKRRKVWWTTGTELSEWYYRNMFEATVSDLREDQSKRGDDR